MFPHSLRAISGFYNALFISAPPLLLASSSASAPHSSPFPSSSSKVLGSLINTTPPNAEITPISPLPDPEISRGTCPPFRPSFALSFLPAPTPAPTPSPNSPRTTTQPQAQTKTQTSSQPAPSLSSNSNKSPPSTSPPTAKSKWNPSPNSAA